MQQLLYISTARSAPEPAMIDNILAVSRRNNARDGLTGLLIVGGRRFLQVLEGEGEQVEAAYRRIERDERHFAMVRLGSKTIEARSFANWEMGYRHAADPSGTDDLATVVARLTECVDDRILRAHLCSFAGIYSSAA